MAFGHWDAPPAGGAPLSVTLAMAEFWFIIFPVLLLATSASLYLLSYGAREEIHQVNPSLEKALFRPLGDLFLWYALPLRISVLFGKSYPTKLKSTIYALRVVYSLHIAFISAFFFVFLVSVVQSL